MAQTVRTRFAPSPTGYMHVGNLRTALYAYLLAKKNDGKFILRIEDTDRERYVEGAVDIIYNTLRQTGLVWDEGPDIGGPYGPYVQSERMGMFKAVSYTHLDVYKRQRHIRCPVPFLPCGIIGFDFVLFGIIFADFLGRKIDAVFILSLIHIYTNTLNKILII